MGLGEWWELHKDFVFLKTADVKKKKHFSHKQYGGGFY